MDDWQSLPERAKRYRGGSTEDPICSFEVTETDADAGATVVGYDHEADPLDIAIPTIVAHCESTDPCALPPLYDAVDLGAVSALFGDSRGADSALGITFQYAGYAVAVGDSVLSVRPTE